jgi:hypothetical protein
VTRKLTLTERVACILLTDKPTVPVLSRTYAQVEWWESHAPDTWTGAKEDARRIIRMVREEDRRVRVTVEEVKR